MAAFLVLAVPGLLLDGFDGFVYGRIAAALVALAVRSVYMRGMLRRGPLSSAADADAAAAGARVRRCAGCCGSCCGAVTARWLRRSPSSCCSSRVYLVTAVRRERPLLDELLGALRGRPEPLALGGER